MKTPRQISFWQDRTQSGGCTAVCTPPFLGPNPAFLRNNPRLLDDNLGLLLHPNRLSVAFSSSNRLQEQQIQLQERKCEGTEPC